MTWQTPVSDGGSPILLYQVYRGTASGTVSAFAVAGALAFTDASAPNGVTYYYQVSAVNAVGEGSKSNEASANPAAGADATDPEIAIASPSAGDVLRSKDARIVGVAFDNIAVAKVEVSKDGTTWVLATGTGAWSAGLTLAEGENTIYARATDEAGNEASVSITVTVDTSAPAAGVSEASPVLPIVLAAIVAAVISALISMMVVRRKPRPAEPSKSSDEDET